MAETTVTTGTNIIFWHTENYSYKYDNCKKQSDGADSGQLHVWNGLDEVLLHKSPLVSVWFLLHKN